MSSSEATPAVVALLARLLDEMVGLRADLARQTPPKVAEKDEPEGLWDANQVAAYLACSKSWVYDAEAAGRLPSLHIGGMLRFAPEAIRRLVRLEQTGAKVVTMKRSSKRLTGET